MSYSKKAKDTLLSKCNDLYLYTKRLVSENQKQELKLKELNAISSISPNHPENQLIQEVFRTSNENCQLRKEMQLRKELVQKKRNLRQQIRKRNIRLTSIVERLVGNQKPLDCAQLKAQLAAAGHSELAQQISIL